MTSGDTDDSASATPENGTRKVEEGPPPPPDGQCLQSAAEANPPGLPGRVNEHV